MANEFDARDAASGLAALSICESLLLALGDLQILGEKDAIGILSDASAAHRGSDASHKDHKIHLAAADIIDRILAGGNSIRHKKS